MCYNKAGKNLKVRDKILEKNLYYRTIFKLTTTKISQMPRPIKDQLNPFHTSGIYRIYRGIVYAGMTRSWFVI